MIFGRVRPNHENDFRVLALVERGRHGTRADPFHQCGDRGGMTQPRAVIDIVGAEAGANEFLEQVSFFVRSLGRAEAGERSLPVDVPDLTQALGSVFERLFPACLAEYVSPIVRIDDEVLVLPHARLADERRGEAMFVLHVVEAVPALDA